MMPLRNRPNPLRLLMMLLACAILPGCGIGGVSKQYGGVAYPEKDSSINGLGIFMKLCNQAGSRCFVASRLSSRLEKADAVILVGNTFHPPAKEARDWLEAWLSAKPGRSVIYFGRDFAADIYYRRQTLAAVPPAQRHRAAIELSEAETNLDTLLEGEVSDDAFCRWFNLKVHRPARELSSFRGPWADDLKPFQAAWPVRVVLEPPQRSEAKHKPKWLSSSNAGTTATNSPQPKKGSASRRQESDFYRSVWAASDINDDETWKAEWSKVPESNVLLAAKDGTPLVTKLTSSRYSGSQILTIVNGAPLLNGSIVEPHFRAVAHKIIDSLQPAKRIAMVPFDASGLLISHVEDEDEVAGLSVLTTWPMNMIVAHLAFLGVLICLALFPILGRPQNLRKMSLSDFGQHAEAVGRMLQKTGDTRYALRIVGEYIREVRGEAAPAWLKSALETSAPVAPPVAPLAAPPVAPLAEPLVENSAAQPAQASVGPPNSNSESSA